MENVTLCSGYSPTTGLCTTCAAEHGPLSGGITKGCGKCNDGCLECTVLNTKCTKCKSTHTSSGTPGELTCIPKAGDITDCAHA